MFITISLKFVRIMHLKPLGIDVFFNPDLADTFDKPTKY